MTGIHSFEFVFGDAMGAMAPCERILSSRTGLIGRLSLLIMGWPSFCRWPTYFTEIIVLVCYCIARFMLSDENFKIRTTLGKSRHVDSFPTAVGLGLRSGSGH